MHEVNALIDAHDRDHAKYICGCPVDHLFRLEIRDDRIVDKNEPYDEHVQEIISGDGKAKHYRRLDEQPLTDIPEKGKSLPAPDKDIPVTDPEYRYDPNGDQVLFPGEIGWAIEAATEKNDRNDTAEQGNAYKH